MKTIDNTIQYYELLMYYDDTSKLIHYELPDGYHYEFYKKGDEFAWVNIHISSGEFTGIEQGLKYFHDFYDSFIEELDKRCFFIVDDSTNEKVGTATVSLLQNEEYGYKSSIDWLAIKKEYQGKGLSRPLISKFISVAHDLGHDKIMLHTQTTTWLAAKLYLDAGFNPLNVEEKIGWNILKTLTSHDKLKMFTEMNKEELYDKRYIEIERQLCDIYKTADFNYSVWYKNGLHNVYVWCNGESDEYKYYIEDDTIRLEKENTKRKLYLSFGKNNT